MSGSIVLGDLGLVVGSGMGLFFRWGFLHCFPSGQAGWGRPPSDRALGSAGSGFGGAGCQAALAAHHGSRFGSGYWLATAQHLEKV